MFFKVIQFSRKRKRSSDDLLERKLADFWRAKRLMMMMRWKKKGKGNFRFQEEEKRKEEKKIHFKLKRRTRKVRSSFSRMRRKKCPFIF